MLWPNNIYRLMYPKEKYIWAQVRSLRETDKAVLVDNGMKIWIPKSRIREIRLKTMSLRFTSKKVPLDDT